MGALNRLVLATLPLVPLPIMRRLSARYIAGETLAEAIACLEEHQGRGFDGILDILGEDVASEAAARTALREYQAGASAIAEHKLSAYVSVKPTHFGLRSSPDLAFELYSALCEHCAGLGQFLRVEMEDHTTTDATLRLFARLREQYDNVGIVLQARLFRTPADIDALGEAPVDVRLVKGIYLEPEAIAHTDHAVIRQAFVDCAKQLFARGHRVALATHDDIMAEQVLTHVRSEGIDASRYEFEVLLGVRNALWDQWQSGGHRVRVYVPFGPQWRSYSQRRLRKNPEILGHVMRNFFRAG